MAIGAPFAGEDRSGRVFIYNGQKTGLMLKESQVLRGAWASSAIPAGFGFTLRGDSDIDNNQYPGEQSKTVNLSLPLSIIRMPFKHVSVKIIMLRN